jgi:hypothetical protein
MVGGVNRFEIGFRDKFEFFELYNGDERIINVSVCFGPEIRTVAIEFESEIA